MSNSKPAEYEIMAPKLSLEKAEEILRNVYHAVGIAPPENCSEVLRRGVKDKSSKESIL